MWVKVPDEELLKEYPNLSKYVPFMNALRKESDRGRVLLSSGFIEQQLKDILLAFLIESNRAVGLLDETSGPLGTFSARTTASFVMGLISEDEHHDLTIIRRIRNDFAHKIHATFETQSIKDRCASLRLKAHDYTSEKMGEVKVPPSGQFDTAATSLIMRFTNRPHYVAKKRIKFEAWPY